MFYSDGIIKRSSVIINSKVAHGFSTRLGGVSTHPYTRQMNLAKGREDPDDIVIKNTDTFAKAVSNGMYTSKDVICARQIHSAKIRYITRIEKGEGINKEPGEDCDGFITDNQGVMPIVRVADCVPILLCASKSDGSPVIGAVHAGWRGTVNAIVYEAVKSMRDIGAEIETFRIAIGAHISSCCFSVGEDFYDTVREIRGKEFSDKYIFSSNGTYYADLTGMNTDIIKDCGIDKKNIDTCEDCTACHPELYHSHRKTGGKRGAMGAGIVIL